MKNCDLGLENAALSLRPRAAFSRPRSQFFTIRTSQPVNNIYIIIKSINCSLGSKRFRGVGEQRKSEKQDFRCFARTKNGARAKRRKEGVGEGKLPPLPLSFFGFHPIFCTGKTPKIPFLGLSLLPNTKIVD